MSKPRLDIYRTGQFGGYLTRLRNERDDSGHFTFPCLVNRIPDVLAAPPGIQALYGVGRMHPPVHDRVLLRA